MAAVPSGAGPPAAPALDAATSITVNGRAVVVDAVPQSPPLDVAAAVASRPFQIWATELDPRFELTRVTLQSLDFFGKRVGFVKFRAEATFHGKPVPGVVFARGGAVSILPVLHCGAERWVVACRQPRLPVGRAAFLELPAGMLDDSGSFVGVAAKELKEETGITISEDELTDLTALAYGLPHMAPGSPSGSASSGPLPPVAAAAGGPLHGMYPSVGGCDEFLRLLYFRREVDAGTLAGLRGKLTGNIDEHEHIVLELVRYEDMWRATPDGKTLASLLLLERLQAEGTVPR